MIDKGLCLSVTPVKKFNNDGYLVKIKGIDKFLTQPGGKGGPGFLTAVP